MKLKTLTTCFLALSSMAFAQVQMTDGPALENDKDNKMNRMLGGDENSYYCYRIRSKGKGTSFFVEKYDKKTLKPLFSKEVNLDEEGQTKIEDVEYAN
jgi:transcription antitermination factor NusA-like protein